MNIALQQSETDQFHHRVNPQPSTAPVSTQQFLQGMRRFAGAVNIITVNFEGVSYGLTATSVCSLSAEPPRLLACVNMKGATFKAIQDKGAFAVNTLAVGQEGIASSFGGAVNGDLDRFAAGDWGQSSELGLPLLKDACCTFECALCEIIDSGTHALLIADIVHVTPSTRAAPLVYHDGAFCGLLEL